VEYLVNTYTPTLKQRAKANGNVSVHKMRIQSTAVVAPLDTPNFDEQPLGVGFRDPGGCEIKIEDMRDIRSKANERKSSILNHPSGSILNTCNFQQNPTEVSEGKNGQKLGFSGTYRP
jgi:hypothetical protein